MSCSVKRRGAGHSMVTPATLREPDQSKSGGAPASPADRQYVCQPDPSLTSRPAQASVEPPPICATSPISRRVSTSALCGGPAAAAIIGIRCNAASRRAPRPRRRMDMKNSLALIAHGPASPRCAASGVGRASSQVPEMIRSTCDRSIYSSADVAALRCVRQGASCQPASRQPRTADREGGRVRTRDTASTAQHRAVAMSASERPRSAARSGLRSVEAP